MNKINIACFTDENYLPHYGVMLCSLLSNTRVPEQIAIYVVGSGISPSEQKKMRGMVARYGARVEFRKIDSSNFPELKKYRHLTTSSYYRIMMADVLDELDKDRETVVICHHGIRSRQVDAC